MVYNPGNKCLLTKKKMPPILSLKLSELWTSWYHSAKSWKPILTWEGWWMEPTLSVFCTERIIVPNSAAQVPQSLQTMAYHCRPFCDLLWESNGSCSTAPAVPHSPVQDHGVKCRDEPFPGLRSGVLSCPFFTAACHSHGSYVNWIWIKYTPTFAQTSSSSSLLVSRKT